MDILVLDTTSKSLKINLGEGVLVTELEFTVSYGDVDSSSLIEGEYSGITSGTASTLLCPAPASGKRRVIRNITLFNNDSITHAAWIKLLDGSDYYIIAKKVLTTNAQWAFGESSNETGISTFLDLGDTPNSYSGKQDWFLGVSGSAVVFTTGTAPHSHPYPSQTGSFITLIDTPQSYAGAGGFYVMVSGTGLVFSSGTSPKEAPLDGLQYGRQSGTWTKVTGSGGSGGIPEAPISNVPYMRASGVWKPAYYEDSLRENVIIGKNTSLFRSGTLVTSSVMVGSYAGYGVHSGTDNTIVGNQAAYTLVHGRDNVAIGSYAIQSLISGSFNTAVGQQAIGSSKHGNGNTALGYQSLQNISGSNNIAIGYRAGYQNTTGSYQFLLDSYQRASMADQIDNQFMYGQMGASRDNQSLVLNASLYTPRRVWISGTANEEQLSIVGYSSQTGSIVNIKRFNGQQLFEVRDNGQVLITGSQVVGFPEAPLGGLQYSRQSGTWTQVSGTASPLRLAGGFVSNPQSVYTQSDRIILLFTPQTITPLQLLLKTNLHTGTQITGNLMFSSETIGTGTWAGQQNLFTLSMTSGTYRVTSFATGTVPANSYVYLLLSASPVAGIKQFFLQLNYRMD